MKHSFLCVALVLFALFSPKGSQAQGQETYLQSIKTKVFWVGAKAGGSFNQFSQPGTTLAGNIGGFVRFQALPFLQVEGGIYYAGTGGGRHDLPRDLSLLSDQSSERGEFEGPIGSLEYWNRNVNIQTAQIPLSVRLNLPAGESPIQPSFIAGGSYAHIFYAEETRDSYFTFTDGSRIVLSDTKENVTSDYNTFNVAIHGGFGLDFTLENGRVFGLEFLYSQGITDLNEIQLGQPENIEKLRTRSLSINVSYSIF